MLFRRRIYESSDVKIKKWDLPILFCKSRSGTSRCERESNVRMKKELDRHATLTCSVSATPTAAPAGRVCALLTLIREHARTYFLNQLLLNPS